MNDEQCGVTNLAKLCNLVVSAHAANHSVSMDGHTERQCREALDAAVRLIPQLINEEASKEAP